MAKPKQKIAEVDYISSKCDRAVPLGADQDAGRSLLYVCPGNTNLALTLGALEQDFVIPDRQR